MASATLPSHITAARRVFISNAGGGPVFQVEHGHFFNQLHAAMKSWGGKYELVDSPAEADLVFEVRLVGRLEPYGDKLDLVPLLNLAILDPKTRYPSGV